MLRDAPCRVDPPPLEHGLEGRRQHLAVARRAAARLLERLGRVRGRVTGRVSVRLRVSVRVRVRLEGSGQG